MPLVGHRGLSSNVANPPPGQDLVGNTFWEFKDALNAGRWRRIVKFDPRTEYSEVKVSRK